MIHVLRRAQTKNLFLDVSWTQMLSECIGKPTFCPFLFSVICEKEH